MESSNPLSSQSAMNISMKSGDVSEHRNYLQQLLQAEDLFIEDDHSSDKNEYKSFRQPVEKILYDEKSELTNALNQLTNLGVKHSLSEYIFKLLASYTIKNNKRYSGSTNLRVDKIYNSLGGKLPLVFTALQGYEISSDILESSFKTVIQCTLINYRNKFFDLLLEDWSCWESLPGNFTSAPCLTLGNDSKLHLFVRSSDKNLFHNCISEGKWSEWKIVPGDISSAVCAVKTKNNNIQLIAKGKNNNLLIRSLEGYRDSWSNLDGDIISAPCQCLCENGELHIFARGKNNDLVHIVKDTKEQWSPWESLGGSLTSAPASVSWGGNRIDVFARGENNNLLHRYYYNLQWSPWENLGGNISSAPAVSSRTSNRLDIFARGSDNQLLWRIWNGVNWSSWIDLGGYLTSSPSSISVSPDRIDVFAKGVGNQLIYISNK